MAIVCPTCRAVYVDGTLFCEQCGNWLIGVSPQPDSALDAGGQDGDAETSPHAVGTDGLNWPGPATAAMDETAMTTDEVPWLQPVGGWEPSLDVSKEAAGTLPLPRRSEAEAGKPSPPASSPTRLRVLILNTGRLTEWIDDPVIQVGRTDRSVNVFPQIDLEVDGGHNAGVSRRHVRIQRQPEGYTVEDLGSINGTFLNRRRLSPGSSAELRDGDELRVGNVVLRVQLGGSGPRG